ncbi:carbohydrate ABC transporter permease [Kitasatospora purpeofusca]|uniref:carbohydrate ABC transporter permease n=1 Tax=Kitasatospora purpeofusca TaxID=67352 RepID=UPI00364C4CC4
MTQFSRRTPALFIAPFFAVFTFVMVLPIGYAAWMSLFSEKAVSGLGFGGTTTEFTGLGNFAAALTDHAFLAGLGNVALYAAIALPVQIGCALLLALVLDSVLARAKKFFQLTLFLPHAVPVLVAGIVWVLLYTPSLSPLTAALDAVGIHWDFLGPDGYLASLVNIVAWEWIGYNMIIFFAALQALPQETVEATRLDGAGEIRAAWSVKIPMIRPAVILAVLFSCVGMIQTFTEPFLLYNGGAPEMGNEWSPMMFIYSAAFERHDYGLSAAASLLLAAVAAGLSLLVTRLGRRWENA